MQQPCREGCQGKAVCSHSKYCPTQPRMGKKKVQRANKPTLHNSEIVSSVCKVWDDLFMYSREHKGAVAMQRKDSSPKNTGGDMTGNKKVHCFCTGDARWAHSLEQVRYDMSEPKAQVFKRAFKCSLMSNTQLHIRQYYTMPLHIQFWGRLVQVKHVTENIFKET